MESWNKTVLARSQDKNADFCERRIDTTCWNGSPPKEAMLAYHGNEIPEAMNLGIKSLVLLAFWSSSTRSRNPITLVLWWTGCMAVAESSQQSKLSRIGADSEREERARCPGRAHLQWSKGLAVSPVKGSTTSPLHHPKDWTFNTWNLEEQGNSYPNQNKSLAVWSAFVLFLNYRLSVCINSCLHNWKHWKHWLGQFTWMDFIVWKLYPEDVKTEKKINGEG